MPSPRKDPLVAALDGWAAGEGPLYLRLADALEGAVRRGAIGGGTRVPPERTLAARLGVSRTTVVAAYDRLREAQVLESRQGSGTWIRGSGRPRAAEPNAALWSDVLGGGLEAAGGEATAAEPAIDFRRATLPAAPGVAEALAAALPAAQPLLATDGYVALGLPALRRAIADRYARAGLRTTVDEILVTSGAQQAFALVVALLVRPGDVAVLESPSYVGAIDLLNAAGARLRGVPVDAAGVDVDRLGHALRAADARLCYLMPAAHNPTGARLPERARRELGRLAQATQVPIVEDDAVADFSYAGDRPAPIAAYARGGAPVLTIGSASKLAWGGLRTGWIRGPAPIVARLARCKALADLGGALPTQLAAAALLGRADEIARGRIALLRARRDRLAAALRKRLPGFRFELPDAGLSIWVRLPHGSAEAFAPIALRHGVAVAPGPVHAPDGGHGDALRLPFVHEPATLDEGVARLARAFAAYAPGAEAPRAPLELVV